MIVIDVDQNTDAWTAARLGHPTASAFGRILTPTGRASTQATAYRHELIAEWLTGRPGGYEEGAGWQGNAHTERGHALEDEARAWYELETDAEVTQVGHVLTDDRLAGCSPDGLVGADGLVEIKCPKPGTHIGYLLSGDLPTKYIPQIQGQLYICEREWCDFVSYAPLLPPIRIRVYRDEPYIAALTQALAAFSRDLYADRAALQARGITPITPTEETSHE